MYFIRTEVEYLGHVITPPQGLRTNPKLEAAVTEFPVPQNIRETRQFLHTIDVSFHDLQG